MGADRRGPLAAFVIVALIAAILLVTAVRSQAAPWFSTRIVAGPATEPHVWGSVSGGVHQVVREGTLLLRKAADESAHPPADDQTRTEAASASSILVTPQHQSVASPRRNHGTRSWHPTTHRRPAHDGAIDGPGEAPTVPSSPTSPDGGSPAGPPGHGRHLGWYKHHGQEQSEGSSDSGEASEPADADEGAEHGGHDHGHRHDHGNGHDHGHGQHHGRGNGRH